MSLGYFILLEAISGLQNTSLFFSLTLVPWTLAMTHQDGLWGRYHPAVLEKAPFFFLLASDPGESGRVEWHSQTKLDHKLAICQACLRQIPVCHGKKKKEKESTHFLLGFNELSKSHSFPSGFCKCGNWSKWNTCRQLNDKIHPFEFCYLWNFLVGSFAVPLDRKPYLSPGNDCFAPTANWCYLCGIVVIYSHFKGNDWMALWFLPRNCRAI